MAIRVEDVYVTYQDGVEVNSAGFEAKEYSSYANAYKKCIEYDIEALRAGGADIIMVDGNTITYYMDDESLEDVVMLYTEDGDEVFYDEVRRGKSGTADKQNDRAGDGNTAPREEKIMRKETELYNLIIWDCFGDYKVLEFGKTLEQCKMRRDREIENLGTNRWRIHSYKIVPYQPY